VVAKRVGISKQQLSDYENGRKLPSIEQAIRLCTALEMPVSVALRCLLDEQIQQAGITGYRISLEKVG
jgi:transcriptional regulator with XRE-family HTH domain